MKKVKFTLGLALSMLFVGANVSHAADYDNTCPHDGKIKITCNAKPSQFYAGEGITFGEFTVDQHDTIVTGGWVRSLSPIFSYADLIKDTTAILKSSDLSGWCYGHSSTHPADGSKVDYYLDNQYVGEPNALYYNHKVGNRSYNKLKVLLGYQNGNDLTPVIKRTITLGDWETTTDDSHKLGGNKYRYNKLKSTGITISEYLVADSSWFRPEMDRETGIATYVYNDELVSLLEKYIIYSIHYEISTNDEVGSPNGDDYQPPVLGDVTTMRGVQIDAEAGISTSISTVGNVHYIPSQSDLVFTAYSKNDITVTTSRGEKMDKDGVRIVDNKDNSYTVTVRKVQSNITVYVKSVKAESGEGGEGQTGTEVIAKDKVWAANGTLYVEAINPATMSVYTVTGQLYKQIPVTGSFSTTIPKGLYIVQLNGKAYKVIL